MQISYAVNRATRALITLQSCRQQLNENVTYEVSHLLSRSVPAIAVFRLSRTAAVSGIDNHALKKAAIYMKFEGALTLKTLSCFDANSSCFDANHGYKYTA